MNRTRTVTSAALALALALPVAACGGDEKSDQFREDYNAAVERLSKINDDIGQAGQGTAGRSNREIANEFNTIAETAEQTRTRLGTLDPPGDAQDEFDDLLTALERGVQDLRAVAKAARSGDPQRATHAVQELNESGQQITAAEDALKKAVDG
jgi:hypothetical protein